MIKSTQKMINVGVVGASGYSGAKVCEILLRHPHVRLTYVSANNTQGRLDEIWPQLKGITKLVCKPFNLADAKDKCEVLFLAVPHKISMQLTPSLLKSGIRVIDLSGDYRLDNAKNYNKWYGVAHEDARNLKKAVYGLPELYKEDIKKANLIANPGCYPTACVLALAPLFTSHAKLIKHITVDAKSGVSGAGRKANVAFNFCEVNENFKAYKVLKHQHTPEITQYLGRLIDGKEFEFHFVPHLLPMTTGILETIYVKLKDKISLSKVHTAYRRFYKTEPFVRLMDKGVQPELKHVVGTNFCDIGLSLSEDKTFFVVTSVIDNLIKGAAGQAVQNMNLMYGFDEIEGLR